MDERKINSNMQGVPRGDGARGVHQSMHSGITSEGMDISHLGRVRSVRPDEVPFLTVVSHTGWGGQR